MSNPKRSPFDVPAANECGECQGRGYTYATAQVVKPTNAGPETVDQGSGCPRCLGTGRLIEHTYEQ